MSIIVNTNVQSLVAQRNLTDATNGLNRATERLSTGLKINRAVDDSAGLYVATGLASQLSGLEQCQTNISLGINVLQITEGDLTTIQNDVMRIKDLTTQAASSIYSTASRNALAQEITARVLEINRIAAASSFNGLSLLAGVAPLGTAGFRIQVGAGSDQPANSIVIDSTIFKSASAGGIGLTWATATSIATTTAAAAFIKTCEDVLTEVTNRRTTLGVAQSRLEMAAEGLATTIENVASAKSTIMDTDVASEVSNYTKQQILQQISTSILTQANQAPSVALSLLQ